MTLPAWSTRLDIHFFQRSVVCRDLTDNFEMDFNTCGAVVSGALGTLDIGQACVVARGHALAVEAAEGTDRLLQRVTELRRARGRLSGKRIVGLVKRQARAGPPGELADDGAPRTLEFAAEAWLAGIAVQAGNVLLVEGDVIRAEADKAGLFVVGVSDDG